MVQAGHIISLQIANQQVGNVDFHIPLLRRRLFLKIFADLNMPSETVQFLSLLVPLSESK